MKVNRLKSQCLILFLLGQSWLYSQTIDYSHLKLKEAIEIGLKENKKLKATHGQTKIAELKVKDLKNEKLPEVKFHTSFHVLGNIRQYENGFLNPSTKYEVPRLKYDFTLSAEVPIYYGGKLRYDDEKAEIEVQNSELSVRKSERELRMQIITAYLQVLHLQEQKKLISEKMREDEAVISQTEKLEKNGVVTYNEVLRTKLQLSNHRMSYDELSKEIEILEHRIKTILAIPESEETHVVTDDLFTNTDTLGIIDEMVLEAYNNSETLKISKNDVELKELDKKLTRTNILPKISAGAEYGYNYPNFMFFPPQSHLYRFGSVGVNLVLPLDNFYKNKVKMQMSEEKIDIAKLEVEHHEEQIRDDVYAANKRLEDAVDKLPIAQEAIDQAKENYRIVKLKYANKLSLITELIDADNALLEAQSNMISLQINKQLKFYQLQYVLGNL